jgi:hypothetical protein
LLCHGSLGSSETLSWGVGKRTFGRPRHRWEDNIKMAVKEIRREDVDWIHLDNNRVQWWAVFVNLIHIMKKCTDPVAFQHILYEHMIQNII